MKMTHGETDSMRLERYERLMLQGSVSTPTIESNGKKIFDCSECGLFFKTEVISNEHNVNQHSNGLSSAKPKDEEEFNFEHDIFLVDTEGGNINIETKFSSDDNVEKKYEIEYLPDKVAKEKKMYIKIHEESEDFDYALRKVEGLLKKDSEYNFEGCQVKVKEDLKVGKPAKIEVSTENIKGFAGVRFLSSRKHGKSFVISRSSKNEFDVVEALTLRFVKPILDLNLNSNKEHADVVLKHLVKYANNKTFGKKKNINELNSCCTHCGFVAKSDHGVRIHIGKMHPETLEAQSNFPCPLCQLVLKTQIELDNHMSIEHKAKAIENQKYECRDCNQEFQNTEQFNEHITTHRKLNIDSIPGVKFKCDHCDFESLATKQIRVHMEENHKSKESGTLKIPLLNSNEITNSVLNRKIILGKRKSPNEVNSSNCETCGEFFVNERELRLHTSNKHITEKEVTIGTKRDESFLIRSDSFSPKRKQNKLEEMFVPEQLNVIKESSTRLEDGDIVGSKKVHSEIEEKLKIIKEREDIEPNKIVAIETDPNTRMLPEPVKKLVSKGSKEATVPGDGTCLIGTTTTHIEGDTENTRQLSRNLNTHIAMYRPVYLPKIEADFLMTVLIGTQGETKTFLKGHEQEFFLLVSRSSQCCLYVEGLHGHYCFIQHA